jgi:hypothetical protein
MKCWHVPRSRGGDLARMHSQGMAKLFEELERWLGKPEEKP